MGAIDEAKAFRLETEFGSLGISKGNGSHGNERPLEGTRERGEPREQTVPRGSSGEFLEFQELGFLSHKARDGRTGRGQGGPVVLP